MAQVSSHNDGGNVCGRDGSPILSSQSQSSGAGSPTSPSPALGTPLAALTEEQLSRIRRRLVAHSDWKLKVGRVDWDWNQSFRQASGGDDKLQVADFLRMIRRELRVQSHVLSDDDIQDLFNYLDVDGSSEVGPEEFRAFVMEQTGQHERLKHERFVEKRHIVANCDINEVIQRLRGRLLAATQHLSIHDFDNVFRNYSSSGDGTTAINDFVWLLRSGLGLGMNEMSEDEIKVLFAQLDDNASGSIRYVEFVEFLRRQEEIVADEGEQDFLTRGRKKANSKRGPARCLRETLSETLRRFMLSACVDIDVDWEKGIQLFSGDDGGLQLRSFLKFSRNYLQIRMKDCSESDLQVVFAHINVDGSGSMKISEFRDFIEKQQALEYQRRQRTRSKMMVRKAQQLPEESRQDAPAAAKDRTREMGNNVHRSRDTPSMPRKGLIPRHTDHVEEREAQPQANSPFLVSPPSPVSASRQTRLQHGRPVVASPATPTSKDLDPSSYQHIDGGGAASGCGTAATASHPSYSSFSPASISSPLSPRGARQAGLQRPSPKIALAARPASQHLGPHSPQYVDQIGSSVGTDNATPSNSSLSFETASRSSLISLPTELQMSPQLAELTATSPGSATATIVGHSHRARLRAEPPLVTSPRATATQRSGLRSTQLRLHAPSALSPPSTFATAVAATDNPRRGKQQANVATFEQVQGRGYQSGHAAMAESNDRAGLGGNVKVGSEMSPLFVLGEGPTVAEAAGQDEKVVLKQAIPTEYRLRAFFDREVIRQQRLNDVDRWELLQTLGASRELAEMFCLPWQIPLSPFRGTRDAIWDILRGIGCARDTKVTWEEISDFCQRWSPVWLRRLHSGGREVSRNEAKLIAQVKMRESFEKCDPSDTGKALRTSLARSFGNVKEIVEFVVEVDDSGDTPLTKIGGIRDLFEDLFLQGTSCHGDNDRFAALATVSWEEFIGIWRDISAGAPWPAVSAEAVAPHDRMLRLVLDGDRDWHVDTQDFWEEDLLPALDGFTHMVGRLAEPRHDSPGANDLNSEPISSRVARSNHDEPPVLNEATWAALMNGEPHACVGVRSSSEDDMVPPPVDTRTWEKNFMMRFRDLDRALKDSEKVLLRYCEMLQEAVRIVHHLKSGLFEAGRKVAEDTGNLSSVLGDAMAVISRLVDRTLSEAAALQERAEKHAPLRRDLLSTLWQEGVAFEEALVERRDVGIFRVRQVTTSCDMLFSQVEELDAEVQALRSSRKPLPQSDGHSLDAANVRRLLRAFASTLLPHWEVLFAGEAQTPAEAATRHFLAAVKTEAKRAGDVASDTAVQHSRRNR
eukprot:TRINITY_DN67445_c0_g1_i1.p1 TRINITY_DN67445_c0_g1~~TRINITY_DN67445_c0_g1_i1.p1  ORF type:complete len:1316 (-),score=212.26 TRINITY_DN67445_c0_g1_i1:95-4042(-)